MDLVNPIVRRWLAEAEEDPDAFWARAAEELHWFRPWKRVFQHEFPSFRWFVGGETNLAYGALDRHVAAGRSGHTALVYANERGERRALTYAQLLHEVERTSAALRGLGVEKGDRITLYMPTCPEAIVLMLAAARIGAIHLVVFAGFGAGALSSRVVASGSRVVFTADVTWRKGKETRLKEIVDDALAIDRGAVEHVVVLRRGATPPPWTGARDVAWPEFLALGGGHSGACEPMEANEPAFILATSGTTARPKLAIHVHGGYGVHVHAMGRWCFGLRPSDVWWSTSDIGWIVGHSYIVYAPLLTGCTTVAYEGALDHPGPETLWKIVEELRVTGLFTSPTAVRLLMKYGAAPARGFDHRSLERVFCAGEVLNPPAWEWLQREVLRDRVPVIDHMWQTETGGPVFGNPYGLAMLPIKPGSAGLPLPGIEATVVSAQDGRPVPPGEKGIMVLTRPFPGLTPTLWGEPERYASDYWQRIPGVYYTGDSAHVDEDGYVFFAGRADEIIKIAGHKLGTIEVETAFLTHPAVAEAGVTGRPDPVRGEVVSAFVALRQGHEPSAALRRELVEAVRRELGPVAVIGEVNFVRTLPKTRSGKIMRRVFKAVILDRDPGDITTIEDEGSVDEARRAWAEMRAELAAQRPEAGAEP
ncbi:acetate--CoA ligase [Anaeromyxobacter oryzae]|uniref:Acetyl-CoA synthetase n=1 Tax=Anaeromyxobacter oryzae TaxID=2918170 RepID=A0ABM7WRM5_9BACT|nr:acetate--CoA ligase [Anaeromyxobacter oryzae]BDG02124.1 acetyl-CoA synthetase [Anaeromyxobacter oryzae]